MLEFETGFSSDSGIGVVGEAPDGEVEDYAVTVATSSWQNTSNPLDVNDDGDVVAQDILIVVNELNNHDFSDPVTGLLDPAPPSDNFFYDVNGDGFISPRDALAIINSIQTAPQAPLSAGAEVWDNTQTGDDEEESGDATRRDWIIDEILDDVASDIASAWGR